MVDISQKNLDRLNFFEHKFQLKPQLYMEHRRKICKEIYYIFFWKKPIEANITMTFSQQISSQWHNIRSAICVISANK